MARSSTSADRPSNGAPGQAWTASLRKAPTLRIAVVGGSGRLGSWLVRFLAESGHSVVVVDTQPPAAALPHLEYVQADVLAPAATLAAAVEGSDAVVHLAGIHGLHLAAGVSRRYFWSVNVHGTQNVLASVRRARVPRFILASSTSVYGPGSAPGEPARVLDESTELRPDDIYDLTKIAAEKLAQQASDRGTECLALRFGRFFFPSVVDYNMRKLSTGLDVRDACQAISLAVLAPAWSRPAYCVASDLPLSRDQRERLGIEPEAVLQQALPKLVEAARRRGILFPAHIGKSVSSDALRGDLGYRPERTLAWLMTQWSDEPHDSAPARRRSRRLRIDPVRLLLPSPELFHHAD